MKIVFLARALDSSKIIANLLVTENLVEAVVFETGKMAKEKKLNRMLRRKPFWRFLLLPLDIAFLLYMTRKANHLFYKKYPQIPDPKIDLWVDDVNESRCLDFVRQQNPDILVIFGTAILKKPLLNIPKICTLNIHGGLVPKYRNVHGEFWAVAHHNYHELGTSILVTDEGIDSGDIVYQNSLGLTSPLSVSEAKLVVFEQTLKVVRDVIAKAKLGEIPRTPQEKSKAPVFQTPGFLDWIKFRVKI